MALCSRLLPELAPEAISAMAFMCPNGSPFMTLRSLLREAFTDTDFVKLYDLEGRPSFSPAQLVLIITMQFLCHRSDRGAVEDMEVDAGWRYALGLRPGDTSIDASTLCLMRGRLVAADMGRDLLDRFLETVAAHGLVRSGGHQRTDSTAVYAAVRRLNRAELLGETFRATLEVLSHIAESWLRSVARPTWWDHYVRRIEAGRLPETGAALTAWMQMAADDGWYLLAAATAPDAPPYLVEVPALRTLLCVWDQQCNLAVAPTHIRPADTLAPASELVASPYDTQARFRTKRDEQWVGTLLHVTETSDPDGPSIITDIREVPATDGDSTHLAEIQDHLKDIGLAPSDHFVDGAYVSAEHLARSAAGTAPRLVGPAHLDTTWQATANTGFAKANFVVDWEAKTITCPAGQTSAVWRPPTEKRAETHVAFGAATCAACPVAGDCTTSVRGRIIKLKSRAEEEALAAARREQATPAWHAEYGERAGIEGTFSATDRRYGLTRARYRGTAKIFLQHIFTVIATNIDRIFDDEQGRPRAKTRTSQFARLALAA